MWHLTDLHQGQNRAVVQPGRPSKAMTPLRHDPLEQLENRHVFGPDLDHIFAVEVAEIEPTRAAGSVAARRRIQRLGGLLQFPRRPSVTAVR